MTDRVWSTIPKRPLRPFGSAVDRPFPTPELITERPRKLTLKWPKRSDGDVA